MLALFRASLVISIRNIWMLTEPTITRANNICVKFTSRLLDIVQNKKTKTVMSSFCDACLINYNAYAVFLEEIHVYTLQ
jgi:hypothetical protein